MSWGMHAMELKDELKKLEHDLSTLVARFLKVYDEFAAGDDGNARPATPEVPEAAVPQALSPGFTTDYLTAYV
jgi:hypothetical protein